MPSSKNSTNRHSVRDALRVRPKGGRVDLGGIDPSETNGVKRHWADERTLADEEHVMQLQDRLHAEARRSVLIVLQGMDTSGKDGTIRYALRGLNPQGVRIVSFKAPSALERRHDFLWRIKRALPNPGEIVIFNRSHYEDVLIARVKGLVSPAVIRKRYAIINRFEAAVMRGGTAIVKVYLHISEEEQRRRLLGRLNDPDKHWKFRSGDIAERANWDAYQRAYAIAIGRCSPAASPWYVVPANRKWYRNWAVAQLLIEEMEAMNLTYPNPKLDTRALKRSLSSSVDKISRRRVKRAA
ncbi:MAG TPA: PPK2 family polyphosphate kinase [Candidatus Dormibacteraeota bacterium]|nr:PPK2 family polyphosphate kinase [Candidatus Dormibacteraeota bacterium]